MSNTIRATKNAWPPSLGRPGIAVSGGHVHWIFFAYNRTDNENRFVESTSVDVVAETMQEAEDRVRELVPGKAHYYLTQVVEHLTSSCGR